VIWTSGGIDKLEVYRRLRVREVWIWKSGRIEAATPSHSFATVLPASSRSALRAHLIVADR
jgi:hypothetical protein